LLNYATTPYGDFNVANNKLFHPYTTVNGQITGKTIVFFMHWSILRFCFYDMFFLIYILFLKYGDLFMAVDTIF